MRQRSVTVYLLINVIHKRPKLQQDLFDVLLRFRWYLVVVVCDIDEMYLQIGK